MQKRNSQHHKEIPEGGGYHLTEAPFLPLSWSAIEGDFVSLSQNLPDKRQTPVILKESLPANR